MAHGTPYNNEEVKTGTTIMAIKYKDGVVLGADTRTSSGRFVVSRFTNKLTRITDKIYCCRSGSAADTRIIADIVELRLKEYEAMGVAPTVRRAATLCQQMIYDYPQLTAGMIVAGYDDDEKGSVYNITLGGSFLKMDIALGGSGSIFVYSYCDVVYRNDFDLEQATKFVSDVVSQAIKRDNWSGGCVRIAVINSETTDIKFIPGNELEN